MHIFVLVLLYSYILLLHCILGIAVTGASNVSTDLVSSNHITDYSFIIQPFTLDPFNSTLRCVSGLGPSGYSSNVALGGWYFNGAQLLVSTGGSGCELPWGVRSETFLVRGANGRRYPGVVNLYQCGNFNIAEEGIYSCIMMNSSMMIQTMRVGVYFDGRSESLYIYPITSLLTIFHFSTQLLQ